MSCQFCFAKMKVHIPTIKGTLRVARLSFRFRLYKKLGSARIALIGELEEEMIWRDIWSGLKLFGQIRNSLSYRLTYAARPEKLGAN